MVRTIEEYIKAKKRLSIEVFTIDDIMGIINTQSGCIIVNNVKIPIKNGALDLTQWISKDKVKRVKRSQKESKEAHKQSQRKHRAKIKDLKEKGLTLEDSNDNKTLYELMPNIFRDSRYNKPLNTGIKRTITAKRILPVVHKPSKISRYANVPIQFLLRTTAYILELGSNNGDKIDFKGYSEYIARTNRINKHYVPNALLLKAIDGTMYKYTDKGLKPV